MLSSLDGIIALLIRIGKRKWTLKSQKLIPPKSKRSQANDSASDYDNQSIAVPSSLNSRPINWIYLWILSKLIFRVLIFFPYLCCFFLYFLFSFFCIFLLFHFSQLFPFCLSLFRILIWPFFIPTSSKFVNILLFNFSAAFSSDYAFILTAYDSYDMRCLFIHLKLGKTWRNNKFKTACLPPSQNFS